jgi:uncharacterized glyoxalase superfamily protein PhnB
MQCVANETGQFKSASMTTFGRLTPILRIFDEAKAKEFYVDFLSFKIDWDHRFAEDLPLYMQVSKDDCILHLSGHFGDCCPGSAVRIETTGVEEYQQELLANRYKHVRPGIQKQSWGTTEMCITDPFGNRLVFFKPA